ncbi:MAG: HdeA/HdeB family chaperone [Hyphomicrobium sp.]|nr:HdeA/HdeB family chaperone [Hyphomicrobium sp.]
MFKRHGLSALVALASLLSLPASASAEMLDAAAFSCQELTEAAASADAEAQMGATAILHWIHAYLGTEEQGSVVDFDVMKTAFDKTKEFCAGHPNIGVLTAAGKFMGENEPAPGKSAVDVAIMTCEQVVAMAQEDEKGTVEMLMWIVGYHASSDSNTLIDMTKFADDAKKLGTYCAENKRVGFLTASEQFMAEAEEETADQ